MFYPPPSGGMHLTDTKLFYLKAAVFNLTRIYLAWFLVEDRTTLKPKPRVERSKACLQFQKRLVGPT